MKKLSKILALILTVSMFLYGCTTSRTGDDDTSSEGGGDGSSSSAETTVIDNSDLVGENLGEDIGFGPVGFDLDAMAARLEEHLGTEAYNNLRFGIAVPHQINEWQIQWAETWEMLDERFPFEITVLNADLNQEVQTDQINNFVNQGYDGISIYPAVYDAMPSVLNPIADEMVVVSCIALPETVELTTCVAELAEQKGATAAQKAMENYSGDETIRYMTLDWSGVSQLLNDRVKGFIAEMESYDNTELAGELKANNTELMLGAITDSLLVDSNVDIIFGSYGNPAQAIINGVEQVGLDPSTLTIVATDPNEVILDYVASGDIAGVGIGFAEVSAMQCLFEMMRGLMGEELPHLTPESGVYADFWCDASNVAEVKAVLYGE